ncbi:MAG: tetratricopeptide repeat protein [Acidobacteria bacterium]|nr:tetratricopeptide repeat protein [Acidobacteriota bacterium]
MKPHELCHCRLAALAVVAVMTGACSAHAGKFPDGVLDPAQLLKIVSDSKQLYELHGLDELPADQAADLASVLWPTAETEVEYPKVVVEDDGDKQLTTYPLDPRCLELLQEAEPTFAKGEHEAAGKLYSAIVEQYPTCYPATAALGDSYQFDGRYEAALPWYQKTIELNPHDFIGYFFQASALLHLGRSEEARQSYIEALARRPHRPTVVTAVRRAAGTLGYRALEKTFVPRAMARREGEKIAVYADLERPYRAAYGLCKAIWLGEPEYTETRGGGDENNWSLRAEEECLGSLAVSYFVLREDPEPEKPFEPDPDIEDLLAVAEADLLDGFVLYELAYHFHPQMTLLVPEDLFDEVRAYLDAFVLPLKETAEPPAGSVASAIASR